jgi:thiamine kinase-like enzyme
MNDLLILRNIIWNENDSDFQALLTQDNPINITPMDSGLEADVFRISMSGNLFVLKVWNRNSKPNISTQYKLLKAMYNRGAAVSKPFGWGVDKNNNQVLLTSFDGGPIHKLNKKKVEDIADILIEIHMISMDEIGNEFVPKYDFVNHFFPRICEHVDINDQLLQLLVISNLEQKCLIHGDYHLGNILELNRKYLVIDWTNIQLGDPRYDIAWSIIIMWIYVGEKQSSTYRSVILTKTIYSGDELEKFEAMACLRWALLNRLANLPKRSNTISRVRTILMKNRYLNENLI